VGTGESVGEKLEAELEGENKRGGKGGKARSHFTGPKKLGNSRTQPPPTFPRNVYAPIQNIMHWAV
jgi:hypothetical protein